MQGGHIEIGRFRRRQVYRAVSRALEETQLGDQGIAIKRLKAEGQGFFHKPVDVQPMRRRINRRHAAMVPLKVQARGGDGALQGCQGRPRSAAARGSRLAGDGDPTHRFRRGRSAVTAHAGARALHPGRPPPGRQRRRRQGQRTGPEAGQKLASIQCAQR